MSKITFRADDELIDELETLETSKSEAMREALREYLARNEEPATDSLDAMVAERVEALIDERMGSFTPSQPQDVHVNITIDGDSLQTNAEGATERKTNRTAAQTESKARKTCAQCGDEIDEEHVYCPNCGEKAAHRVFCDCGDELRSDWGFCPSCGRRTPAADVLDGA
jgi:predicted RNA-binding Zn-ribbon protein involved in translation (DUF1610 family)/Arc/MetJ-type ribon-helix-helix transcriptional regulator